MFLFLSVLQNGSNLGLNRGVLRGKLAAVNSWMLGSILSDTSEDSLREDTSAVIAIRKH